MPLNTDNAVMHIARAKRSAKKLALGKLDPDRQAPRHLHQLRPEILETMCRSRKEGKLNHGIHWETVQIQGQVDSPNSVEHLSLSTIGIRYPVPVFHSSK